MPHRHAVQLVYVILVIVFASGHEATAAAPPEKLRVGFSEVGTYAFSEKGEGKGSLVEIAHMAFKEMDHPTTVRVYPLKRLYLLLANKQIDMVFTIEKSKLQGRDVVSNSVPIMIVQVYLYTFAKGPVPSVWDLAGEKILSIDGYTYSNIRTRLEQSGKNIGFIEAISPITALRMLKARRATYMLGYKRRMDLAIQSIGADGIQSALIRDIPMYFHMLKTTPNAEPLLQELDAALLKVIRRTGHSAVTH
ncbi:MAG: hypothetical protein COB37_07470 [Kordiimonadales bacterium]|nr:MAG: hypothetical protein COB37_07470 [Kordiimonadales bacterium]